MLGIMQKKPEEYLDYDLDFARWLSDGDTLTNATAVSSDPALNVDATQVHDTVTKVWLSGGEPGQSYQVEVTANTFKGRVKQACFVIRICEC